MRVRTIRDIRGLQSEMDRQQRQARKAIEEDVVIEAPRRLFLRSANGTYWRLDVSDAGALSTTNMGTSL